MRNPKRAAYSEHFKRPHYFFGEWIDDLELERRLDGLSSLIEARYALEFPFSDFLDLCDDYSRRLRTDADYRSRVELLCAQASELYPEEITATIDELANFLRKENLLRKVERELGTRNPRSCRRLSYESEVFEEWRPLGFLVHIAPNNAPAVDILACIEGLLCGNINFLKTSGQSSLLAQIFFDELFSKDPTGIMRDFVIVSRLSSSRVHTLQKVLRLADAVSVWGAEETIASVKAQAGPNVKIIDWGHKISFSFVSRKVLDETLARGALENNLAEGLVKDLCLLDQRACSSPQCLFVETEDFARIEKFSRLLFGEINDRQARYPQHEPDAMEWAELTRVVEVHRLKAAIEPAFLLEDPERRFRLLGDGQSVLEASPLQRTLRIKPLRREDVYAIFHPMRSYLQTLTLSCHSSELADLAGRFFKCGVLRIKKPGDALASYDGEPHDGVMALARFSRRVSLELGAQLAQISSLSELRGATKPVAPTIKVMRKADFQGQQIEARDSQLFFKSGGSSGAPKISVFTYEDYHQQMRLAADGLFAAGIDPIRDRCMNLFHGGGLYGGFLSFFTILEFLKCKQFPMAGYTDLKFVGETIVRQEIDCLLGMPSYIFQVFAANEELLRNYRGIKKIFYGGEHFSATQAQRLQRDFGVEEIRSATYGSVDTGPMGYQCRACEGSVHHLHTELQTLEIFKLEIDEPATLNEIGRLLFSSHARKGQHLIRYEIGDIGRWVSGDCPCGRQSPRFELLGRIGDVFKAGGSFINYQKIEKILIDEWNYEYESQIVLEEDLRGQDRIILLLDERATPQLRQIEQKILAHYSDLKEIIDDSTAQFAARTISSREFIRTQASAKLQRVVDRRSAS